MATVGTFRTEYYSCFDWMKLLKQLEARNPVFVRELDEEEGILTSRLGVV